MRMAVCHGGQGVTLEASAILQAYHCRPSTVYGKWLSEVMKATVHAVISTGAMGPA